MLIATKGSKIDISSEKKTEEIAKKINSEIKPGNILFFMEKWVLVKQHLLNI